ncbi:MAG TPA: alpha/beta fold hydrolase [Steroidobacteraceae bacterium]|jgi:pimeloyl-ACP methyl ester carboxylesterase
MSNDAEPIYFPSGDQTLFGWLHPARGGIPSDAGVVICSPFGYEAICSHRSLRAFADACAAAGIPALRFDYFGTGDSSGNAFEGDQITRWCDDIRAAIKALESLCGVRRIVLVGVRLGALLAGMVAARQPIDGLVAVAPVVSGKRYLRELRAFQAGAASQPAGASAALGGTDVDGAGLSPEPLTRAQSSTATNASLGAGELDVTGFRLSAASVKRLETVDIAKLAVRPGTRALLLDRDDLPAGKAWFASLESQGAAVRYEALPGFLEMMIAPHAAQVPAAMVESLGRWLPEFRDRGKTSAGQRVRSRRSDASRMRLKDEKGSTLTEHALFVDEHRTLFGIVTEPDEGTADKAGYGVLMLNGGAIGHIGPNRMYVELSRTWASRGYVVLRLDLAGLGDSGTRPGQDPNQVYPPGALDDIKTAIEFMRRTYGIRDVTLTGLCAGAYHALRSAIHGLPVNTVLLVNPLTFYWKPGSKLSDLQVAEVVRNPGVYAQNALSLRHWSKLLRGKVNLWRLVSVFVRRAWLGIDSVARDICRRIGIRIPNDVGWDLQSAAARGIRIVFLFARGDTGSELLKVQGGSAVKRLGDRCRVHTIDGADHIFTQRAARTQLLQLLTNELPQ